MYNVQYVYYAHLPLNKQTIHVGILDHTHRVPGKVCRRLSDFGRLDVEVSPVVFFSSTNGSGTWARALPRQSFAGHQAVLCFY